MRARYVAVVAIAVAAVLSTSGCAVKSRIEEKYTPKPTLVTIEATVAAVGASIEGTLTRGFPKTLPMWPGATVAKSKVTKTPQGKSYSAILTTPDPFSDVLAGVGEGLGKAGWKVRATDASSGEATVSILMISNSDADGLLTISQAPKKPVRIEYIITPKR